MMFLCMCLTFCYVDLYYYLFVFFKQKTAYEMRISDWSSDVCSSDLRKKQPSISMRYGARRKTNLPSRPMSSKRSNDTVGAFRSDGRVCRALDLARLRRIPDVGVAGTCQSPQIGRAHV